MESEHYLAADIIHHDDKKRYRRIQEVSLDVYCGNKYGMVFIDTRIRLFKCKLFQEVYSLILGQCTDIMINRLKASSKWQKIISDQDSLDLLEEIRIIIFRF